MKHRKYLIVAPNLADWMTLGTLLLSSLGLVSAFQGLLTLAIGLMLLAMFVDMWDGVLARRLNLESEFGKYLDSFCDVFSYLVLPLFILIQLGMRDAVSIGACFAFLACGLLRLSRFNIVSTVEAGGIEYHLGLQVIWSHLVVVLAFPAWWWLGDPVRYILDPLLFVMSALMICNLRFRKPTSYVAQSVVILAFAVAYLYLHFNQVHTP